MAIWRRISAFMKVRNIWGTRSAAPPSIRRAKPGVLGLTRHLASLWGRDGIRVNSIAPGGVSSGQNGVFYEKYAARVPMGRMATGDDMTGARDFPPVRTLRPTSLARTGWLMAACRLGKGYPGGNRRGF